MRIAFFLLCAVFATNVSVANIREEVIALDIPSPRRDLASIDCRDLWSLFADKAISQSRDAQAIFQLLGQVGDTNVQRIFVALPDEFMWWMRLLGEVSIESLGIAAHETIHAYNNVATRCAKNGLLYYLNERAWPVEQVISSTSNISIAARLIPAQFKSIVPTSRYQRYVVMSGEFPGNDLSVLLDELSAYVAGANLEIRLASTGLYAQKKSQGAKYLDANVGGSVDIMLIVLAYLEALRTHDLRQYNRLKATKGLRAHLQRIWTFSERMLCDARQFSTHSGGLYTVPVPKLKYIYESDLSRILQDFNIGDQGGRDCLTFYFAPKLSPSSSN